MNGYADTGFIVTLYKVEAEVFLSFDERQRKAARAEGLKVKP